MPWVPQVQEIHQADAHHVLRRNTGQIKISSMYQFVILAKCRSKGYRKKHWFPLNLDELRLYGLNFPFARSYLYIALTHFLCLATCSPSSRHVIIFALNFLQCMTVRKHLHHQFRLFWLSFCFSCGKLLSFAYFKGLFALTSSNSIVGFVSDILFQPKEGPQHRFWTIAQFFPPSTCMVVLIDPSIAWNSWYS